MINLEKNPNIARTAQVVLGAFEVALCNKERAIMLSDSLQQPLLQTITTDGLRFVAFLGLSSAIRFMFNQNEERSLENLGYFSRVSNFFVTTTPYLATTIVGTLLSNTEPFVSRVTLGLENIVFTGLIALVFAKSIK